MWYADETRSDLVRRRDMSRHGVECVAGETWRGALCAEGEERDAMHCRRGMKCTGVQARVDVAWSDVETRNGRQMSTVGSY